MEVILNEPTGYYWDFDNPLNFAADGPTPGTSLFSNGVTGPVSKQGPHTETQVKASGVQKSPDDFTKSQLTASGLNVFKSGECFLSDLSAQGSLVQRYWTP